MRAAVSTTTHCDSELGHTLRYFMAIMAVLMAPMKRVLANSAVPVGLVGLVGDAPGGGADAAPTPPKLVPLSGFTPYMQADSLPWSSVAELNNRTLQRAG